MQIEKINKNQLEVILNEEDLEKNNISVHSFMCNSKKCQNLFFNILNFADTKIHFNLKNHKINIELFSIPTIHLFVLLITRMPSKAHLHISKNKYGTFKMCKSFFLEFNKFEDFCMFCNNFKNSLNIKSSLYLFNNCYFLYIKSFRIKDFIKIILIAKEFSSNTHYLLGENANIIIKDSAIETCKKYFI